MAAMIRVVADKGYPEISVSDVVAAAGVSKSTFYQHFDGKQACYLATFDECLTALVSRMRSAADGARSRDPIESTIGAYFATLEAHPAATRFCLVDVYAAGPDAVRRRVEGHEIFVDDFLDLADRGRQPDGRAGPYRFTVRAVVAGVSAIVTNHVAVHGVSGLSELASPVAAFVRASLVADGASA